MKKIYICMIIISNFIFLGAGVHDSPMTINDCELKGDVDSYIMWLNHWDAEGNVNENLAGRYYMRYFNEDNKIDMEKILDNGAITSETIYEYYSNGDLKKTTEYSSGGYSSVITYDYNEDRTELDKNINTGHGVREKYKYYLSDEGRRVEKARYYNEDKLIETASYVYNEDNFLVEKNGYSYEFKKSIQTLYEYDELGRETSMKSILSDGQIYERNCFYDSGFLSKQVSKKYYLKEGEVELVSPYANFICDYSYEFDNVGNWTTKIMTFDDGRENVTFRLIEYKNDK